METLEIAERVELAKLKISLQHTLEEMRTHEKKWAFCLKQIHDQKMWRGTYGSFAEFMEKELGVTKQAGYARLDAQNMREKLTLEYPEESDRIGKMSDVAAREIKKVEPEKRVELIKQIAEKTGTVTASAIKKARGVPEKPKTIHVCSKCGEPVILDS